MDVLPMPVTVVIASAEADQKFLPTLEKHLSVLQQKGTIVLWHPGQILAGRSIQDEQDRAWKEASVLLVLVSSDLLASDELMERIKRWQATHNAHLIPILLRSCDWPHTLFGTLQRLPRENKPLSQWQDTDAACAEIVAGVRQVLQGHPLEAVPQQSSASPSTVQNVVPSARKKKGGLKKCIAFISTLLIVLSILFLLKERFPMTPSITLFPAHKTASLPPLSRTNPPFSGNTSDKTIVATDLIRLCSLLQEGQYQLAYTQLTTTAYQQNNDDSSGGFGFTQFGGVVHCVAPLQIYINLSGPLYTSTDCLIHFVVKSHSAFNYGYTFGKQHDGTWKILTTFSAIGQETHSIPQCGQFTTP